MANVLAHIGLGVGAVLVVIGSIGLAAEAWNATPGFWHRQKYGGGHFMDPVTVGNVAFAAIGYLLVLSGLLLAVAVTWINLEWL